ncbi:MAG TPA: hypothetical protein VG675_01900 [Bryobacteraceae bacterium]|nr:hypothetical protein [Bryobacteraceae bacterium]
MRKVLLAFLVLACMAWAATIKLYLRDGSYQLAREYQVEKDRVRYYSVERSQWEEIPLNLIDLKRTQSEASAHQAEMEKEAKVISEEDKVEREMKAEVSRIPQDPGVYWIEGKDTKVLPAAESAVHTNKGRSILKALAPVPIVSGKGWLELDGAHSKNVFTNPEQEFFLQLSDMERFGIAKLTPKGNVRIVENITFMPVTKEVVEQPDMVETFTRQLAPNGLYKIWSKEPMPAGEYAVIQYTEGKLDMQVWDFAIQPAVPKK